MPLFRCPRCERQAIIPLAFCESLLEFIPYDFDAKAFTAPCHDCYSSRPRQEPVMWHYTTLAAYGDRAVAARSGSFVRRLGRRLLAQLRRFFLSS